MFGRGKRAARMPLSVRERLERQAVREDDGGQAAYTVALSVLVFLLIAALSTRQVTAEPQARTLLEAGIATVAEIDLVLAEHGADLKALAASSTADPFEVPGYPLPVFVGKAEVANSDTAELRALILERSSALVYAVGLAAFDRTGDQSLGTFSSEGRLDLLVSWLSADTYDAASLVSVILAGLVGIVTVVLVLRGEGFGRTRALGVALIFAAVPGVALAWGSRWVAQQFWASDPFGDDLTAITDAVSGVPIRNYLTAGALGVALTIVGGVASLIAGRLEREPGLVAITYRPAPQPAERYDDLSAADPFEPPTSPRRAEDDPSTA
jgi:hypothetical protein